jgi:hypothetical protein
MPLGESSSAYAKRVAPKKPFFLYFANARPQIAADRTSYAYYPGTLDVPSNAVAKILNRPSSITDSTEILKGSAEHMLVSQAGIDGRYSLPKLMPRARPMRTSSPSGSTVRMRSTASTRRTESIPSCVSATMQP